MCYVKIGQIPQQCPTCHTCLQNKDGRWVQEQLPVQVLNTQAQPLTATSTLTAKVAANTVPTAKGAVRPVSAVITYRDISPVITAEHVRDPHTTQSFGIDATVSRMSLCTGWWGLDDCGEHRVDMG